MRMLGIATHEFRYMFFSLQTLVAFVALFGFAALFTAAGDEFQVVARGGNIFINAPSTITFFLLVSGVAAIFVVPSYMATAVLKDQDSRFHTILFATPMSKSNYLFGRFAGAFAALMVVMAAGPIGMFVGTFWPWAMPETLAPTNISHYLVAYFGFLLPTMMLVCALIFAVAVMSQSLLYCYVTVLGLFIFYIAGVGSNTISSLWDPFMLRTFDDQIRYWTAADLNQNLISYTGTVLGNRLIWLGVAAGLFAVAYQSFSFRAPVKLSSDSKPEPCRKPVNTAFRAKANWSGGTLLRQFLFCTRLESMAVLKSVPFMLLMGFSLFLMVVTLTDRAVLYEVNALPVTRILLSDMFEVLIWTLFVVSTFYGAEVVWRDRENKFNQLLDATPAPNWVFVLSKLAALVTVVYAILLLAIVVAVLIQIINGYSRFEFGLYLEQGFLLGATMLFLAVLSTFFQVLVKSRFLGIMLMGFFWLITFGSIGVLGFEHPLLRYALGAMFTPLSDMNGAGRFAEIGLWTRLYYASVAGLLVMLTYVLWNRGTLQPLKYRLKNLKAFNTTRFVVPLAVLVSLFIGSGSFIFYNTNILNEYRTSTDVLVNKIEYEALFRQYQNLPMPRTVDIQMNVDIYPYQQRVQTRGIHVLENKTGVNISTVHVDFPAKLADVPHVKLEGATLLSVNQQYRYYIFALDKPMLPGEQRKLEFETLIHNQGFPHRGADITLVRNGTFIGNSRLAPHIGFDPDLMLTNSSQRRDAGLEPLPRIAKLEDSSQHHTSARRGDSDFVGFEATVSTVADQIAVTSGYLQNQWIEGGRRYFSYKVDTPIMNSYSFLSADYEMLKDQWQGIDVEIFYHQPHSYNVDRIMESAKDSLAYFSQSFGPYRFKQLRILEFPAYRGYAQSFPNTIAYSEDLGFLADIRDSSVIDVPYYVTAHEVAHQWWSHQVMPANTQGAAMLSETLAQYSALLVMEQQYGKDQIRQFLKFELDSYLSGRDNESVAEVPLLLAEGQKYIHYRKGAVIMYALKDYLGEDVVNRALKRLVKTHAFASTPYPTTVNLLSYLKQEAGPMYHGLIEDFVEKITLYDVKLTDSKVEKMPNGRFKVSLDIQTAKFYADGVGNQTEAAFDIPVDIGLFVNNPARAGFDAADVIMLDKRQVADGQSTIEIVVNKKPLFVGIDPYHKLIDREPEDNLRKVE